MGHRFAPIRSGRRRIAIKCNGRFGLARRGLCYIPWTRPTHILVIDDDRDIRDLLAQFLEKQRIRVTAVRDGKEARRAWLNGHYQLVVLDLMLPGESGLDLARWLRSQGEIPIVMLTAMGEETDRIIGLELGADDYVSKPFQPARTAGAHPGGAAPVRRSGRD